MLKRISTGVSQSSDTQQSFVGKAGSDAAAEGKGARQPVFETYRVCVLNLPNATEWPALTRRVQMDLSVKGLVESTYVDIFPSKVFLAQCNSPRLDS